MEIPNPRTLKDITKKGYLQKLAPRTFPYTSHPWKRKFCLLVRDRIYYYDKEESRGSDKGAGVIALQYFDQISEASSKESKKANNVFIVATRDKRFSDQNRHLFSADSADDMRDWLVLIKRAIEQTRETKSEPILTKSAPSSPRANSVISKDIKVSKAEEEAGKVKKRRSGEEKENGGNDRVSDASLRKKRDANSKTADCAQAKNELAECESSGAPTSNCSSLGRKGKGKLIQSNPRVDFKYTPGDLEGMMFGSLGRQLKVDKAKTGSSQISGGSNNSEHSESFGSMDSKKRKAEEQSNDDFLQTSSESSQKMEKLESVTKHRVKGPPGRRMPQHRRAHAMKHRASSMSALAKDGVPENGSEAEGNENSISFVPWLNRSLDLLEDQTAEEALGYIYSDMEDEPEEMFEYNIGFHEDVINEYNIDDVNMMVQNDTTDSFNSCSGAPPLPPRGDANQERHYQLLKQFNQQHQYEQMQTVAPNQTMSPFGTILQNKQNRKSFIANDALITKNNELLISSTADAEYGDGNVHNSNEKLLNSRKEDSNLKESNIRNRQQKVPSRRLVCQPDINKFNMALKDLEKHVVQLDQAVNGITKEVELSKSDLNSVKSGFSVLKKEKEKLAESFSVMSQEATKMKEQVSAALKDSERLQKSATLALVAAERSKSDQLNLKKEYESMIVELRSTIDNIKSEAAESLAAVMKANRLSVSSLVDEESEEDNSLNKDEERSRRKKTLKDMDRCRSSSKQRETDSKSSSYLEFFSRPSSLISNLTSFTRSATEDQERFESSPKFDKKLSRQKPKDKTKALKKSSKKNPQVTVEDIPMMDESLGTPMTMSPTGSDHEQNDSEIVKITNLNHKKSSSESSRLNNMRAKSPKPEFEKIDSFDSFSRPISPFNVGRYLIDGRANSPTRYLHRPGSTPGPMSRQGSMTTVPEDRAIDIRLSSENRPSEPPPPPPTSLQQTKAGIFAISRQNSSPNIATQKSSPALPRQHSLGVVYEDGKSAMSRQGSLLSVPDDRLIVDRTLTMSPSPSMMSFPGSWSTTSLNRQDSAYIEETPRPELEIRKHLPKDPLEQVAGRILSGSSLQNGKIAPYEEKNDEPPLATSSLKRRKKIKKDTNMN